MVDSKEANKTETQNKTDSTSHVPKRKIMWTIRAERFWNALKVGLLEVLKGLVASDRITRRMSVLFILSSVGFCMVLGIAVSRFVKQSHFLKESSSTESATAKNLADFIQKQAGEAKRKSTVLALGSFTLELKKTEGQKPVLGVLNMAEADIVIECDSKETCDYLYYSMPKVRSEISNVFVALDREELMSKEGKKKIKRAILDKLNHWVPSGKVENVYFSKFIIS
jgi:flagellar basal body-associated protein FliL